MADAPALETFVTVAQTGSLQRAAARLHRTQPSLSARLASLESAWETRLFRRHARGMTLTPEGARLLPLAETALAALAAVNRAAGAHAGPGGELRAGSGDALGREVVPRALARLLASRPQLPVRLLEGPTPRLLDALRSGEIDIALVMEAAGPPSKGIVFERLLASPVDVLVPRAEGRAGRSLPLQALAERRIVTLQRGSAFRRHLEGAFAGARIAFRPAVEVGNLSLVRRFVAAGLGVAPVPTVAFPPAGRAAPVARRKVTGIPPVAYAVARRDGVPLGEEARRFLELLRSP